MRRACLSKRSRPRAKPRGGFRARSASMSRGRSSTGGARACIRPMLESDADALIGARAGVMVVTLAPASVTLERIARLTKAGIVVSLGHSEASAEEAQAVFDAGA